MNKEKVNLIPWDPEDEKQYQRMYEQRVNCGWRMDEVNEWKEKQLKGVKTHYWVVLADDLPGREKLLADHVEKYPGEKLPLTDTVKSVNGILRTPTGDKFLPIGHIGLQLCPELIDRFELPSSSIRVTSLYISWALQAGGFGRSAMSQTERIATQHPHNATLIVLDTMTKEIQTSENHLRLLYDVRGMERPKKIRSNEEWYVSLGYDVIPTDEDEPYPWKVEATGETTLLPTVWLKKDISK